MSIKTLTIGGKFNQKRTQGRQNVNHQCQIHSEKCRMHQIFNKYGINEEIINQGIKFLSIETIKKSLPEANSQTEFS